MQRDLAYGPLPRHRLDLYTPEAMRPDTPLIVFLYGGSWRNGSKDIYGFVGEAFASRGFATAVLRYRMPADGWAAGADAPVHDAMRAVRVLRQRQAGRIGVIGFSAGGHLCARLVTEPGLNYPRQDASDDASARPDFAVLMYPVIATTGSSAHPGSAEQLRKAGVAESDLARYSPHLNVGAQTPPTMLVHAADDTSVPVENSLLMYQALLKARVRSELHVFDSGGHGFGLRAVAGKDVAVWPTLVQNWATTVDSTKR